ncbi:aldo/keto reductase [Philodulcilactobacillus myokoensis]|uniref:aldo/keto reductase n=1 Tax=Philodulcilactobacillus myokoensis TaxID=2929573 RepID=UPI0035A24DC2
MPNVKLNNDVLMPQEGFGVYQIPDYEQCKQAVKDALAAGYRAIDTAQIYQNEQAVGDAIKESNVARKDIFLTTKVWVSNFGKGTTAKSIHTSMNKLGTNYLDLVILHQHFGDYYGAYQDLEQLYGENKIRAIGVSNFNASAYNDFVKKVQVIPAINQVETHVFNQQTDLIQAMKKYGTQIESWGPLAEGHHHLFTNDTLVSIGKNHNKSAAQVALRFLVQNGIVVIPKSVHPERMKQNLAIWDFELTDDEMKQIKQLNTNRSIFF